MRKGRKFQDTIFDLVFLPVLVKFAIPTDFLGKKEGENERKKENKNKSHSKT